MSVSSRDSVSVDTITFACQRCCQPLKIHHSLDDPTFVQQVASHLKNTSVGDVLSDIVVSRSVRKRDGKGGPMCDSESNGNGFLVIGDAVPSSANASSAKYSLQVTSRLFDILTDQSVVNHPLCEECADHVIDQMDNKLRILEDECRDYKEYLETLEKKQEMDGDKQASTNELITLREEEKGLIKEETELLVTLEELDLEQKKLESEIAIQQKELQSYNQEEENYWREYNNLKRQFFICDDELQSVNNQLRYAQSQLDKLKRTNVFNATFHIWHSGHFGTINGFRLGRLPGEPVEWSEINAAWGQAALLFHSLAKKMGLDFQRFKLVPYGNHSFLESLEDKSKELPLYSSGGFRFFWNTKFDQAMVAFLDCLQQFKEEVERGDAQFCLPYKMDKRKIEDTKTGSSFSIKIQFDSEEQWTKALKFMLTNLKWALAWVSTQFPKD